MSNFHLSDPLALILTSLLSYRMKASSKRRRTKQEILEAKAAALAKEQAIQDKLQTIDRLKQEMELLAAKQA